jgi:hypothetical protein
VDRPIDDGGAGVAVAVTFGLMLLFILLGVIAIATINLIKEFQMGRR